MQHAHSQLSQQLKATKRAHRLFSSLVEDVAWLLYPSPSPRDRGWSRMPSSA